MKVKTRSGKLEDLSLDKIKKRISNLSKKYYLKIDVDSLTLKVVSSLYDNVSTTELDNETSRIAANNISEPDCIKLASVIAIDNLHKNTESSFIKKMTILYEADIIDDPYFSVIKEYGLEIEKHIDYELDFNFDYFGFKTLENAYLLKDDSKIVERPQDLFMRVAIALHTNPKTGTFDCVKAIQSYDYFSQGYMTHATPTLFNACTKKTAYASCFLLGTGDSVEDLYETVKNCSKISKHAGGIGLHVSNIRAKNSPTNTKGKSGGIVPYLKVLNETARHINQCFSGDTYIYTRDGPKYIENIILGDYVLTDDGSYRSVIAKHRRPTYKNDVLYEVSIDNNFSVKATDKHHFLVLKNNDKKNNQEIHNNLIKNNIIPSFIQLSGINQDDYLIFPVPEESILYLDPDEAKVLGFFCSYKGSIDFINKKIFLEKDKFPQIENIIRKKFKTELVENFYQIDIDDLSIINPDFLEVFIKRIPNFIFYYDRETTKYILEGFLYSFYRELDYTKDYWNISCKENIIHCLFLLGLKIGYVFKDSMNNSIKITNWVKNKPYNSDYERDIIYFNNDFYCKIKSIKNIDFNGYVYDLTIEENSNYTTSVGNVHNSGKRPGSFAIYISTYHADIFDFLEMKLNKTKEEFRALDLFYALWISDLFMKRVKEDGDWYLMCPYQCPDLDNKYGDEFEELYNKYVELGKYTKKIKAQDLWKAILRTQIETGTPYLCYKDSANKKSNQKNLGTIKSSNLCVAPETLILTSDGYFKIKDLENKRVNVWNGEEWSETTIYKTGVNKELLKIYFNNQSYIDCTFYHKFYIKDGSGYKVIDAKDLKKGMELIDCDFPVIDKIAKDPGIEEIPINDTINNKLRFLEDFIICDKYKINSDEIRGLCIENKNEYGMIDHMRLSKFIHLRYMLQTLGCNPYIKYNENELKYKMVICIKDLNRLYSLGFSSPLINLQRNYPNLKKNSIIVEDILYTRRTSDTYCFNEPKRNMGIFNGILLGNCSEIMEYSDKDNIAICNLSSIALPKFIKSHPGTNLNNEGDKYFDFHLLKDIVAICIENLNKVIDNSFYPVEEGRKTNNAYRPLGLGVQGLAYTYFSLRYPFESPEARKLNLEIFETIYYSALEKSMELAKRDGPYEKFETSPASKGILQFDLWKKEHPELNLDEKLSGRWDWDGLKENIKKYGLRNSLLTTCMPTASTSQILGNSESIEPITSNIFTRRVLSGEYIVFNPYLLKDLQNHNLWDDDTKDLLQFYNGSVKNIDNIPDEMKNLYKTVWEISQKSLIDQSADRGLFIDQSQSLNLYVESPSYGKLTSMHFYAWSKGLKTGIYYLRTKSPSSSDKVTIDKERIDYILKNKKQAISCPYIPGGAPPDCEACSS